MIAVSFSLKIFIYISILCISNSLLSRRSINFIKFRSTSDIIKNTHSRRTPNIYVTDKNVNETTKNLKIISVWKEIVLGFAVFTVIKKVSIASLSSTVQYYSKYFFAGGICASFSHGISVPLDVVKTRKQISQEMASLTILDSFKKIINDEGVFMLYKGKITLKLLQIYILFFISRRIY